MFYDCIATQLVDKSISAIKTSPLSRGWHASMEFVVSFIKCNSTSCSLFIRNVSNCLGLILWWKL